MGLARVFLGIAPDEALRERLGAVLAAMAAQLPSIRWTEVSDLHITLVFIGAASAGLIDALHQRVRALATSLSASAFALHGPVLFPDARRPRVLALVPEQPPEFAAWHAPLAAACVELGCRNENRAYRPHMSLARLRQAPGEALAALQGMRGTAREIVLFESRAGHYLPLFRVACGATGSARA